MLASFSISIAKYWLKQKEKKHLLFKCTLAVDATYTGKEATEKY